MADLKKKLDLMLLLPVAIGLLYAGTGGWSAERWNGALAIMGLGGAARVGEKAGFASGYFTYNPQLRGSARRRDEHGRFTADQEEP